MKDNLTQTAHKQRHPRKQWYAVNVIQHGRTVATFSSPALAQHYITQNALAGAYKEFVR